MDADKKKVEREREANLKVCILMEENNVFFYFPAVTQCSFFSIFALSLQFIWAILSLETLMRLSRRDAKRCQKLHRKFN
jgi:hypothetical protein